MNSIGGVRVEHRDNGVRELILDRPACRNSLDAEVFARLFDELDTISSDFSVRAVILTGANGVFSAGADFRKLGDLSEMTEAEVAELLSREMQVAHRLWSLPQPTIAAIDGAAVGAGMSLALACDMRLGSPSMALFPSFIRMGLLPDTGASWLLPRLIGEGAALEVLLAGRPIDAAHAQLLGLVSRVSDDVLAAAHELAESFVSRPPIAVLATKRLLRDAACGDLIRAIEIEGSAQAAAIHGGEFADTFAAWRTSRIAD